jgi:hypothetical protein
MHVFLVEVTGYNMVQPFTGGSTAVSNKCKIINIILHIFFATTLTSNRGAKKLSI